MNDNKAVKKMLHSLIMELNKKSDIYSALYKGLLRRGVEQPYLNTNVFKIVLIFI